MTYLQKPGYPRPSEHPARSLGSAAVAGPPAPSTLLEIVVDPLSALRSTWRLRSHRFPALGAIADLAGPPRAVRATVRHWDSQGRDPCGPRRPTRGKYTREERHPQSPHFLRVPIISLIGNSTPSRLRTPMHLLGCEGSKFRLGT